jgi:hypothetical protein
MCRTPTKINAAVVKNLTPQQSAQLQAAKQLSAVYKLNKCTPDIYQFLLKLVEQHGSLAGMLRTASVPLSHVGYQLPAPGEGVDLQHMQLTASLAVTAMQSYAQQVHAGCAALGWQQLLPPLRPVLLPPRTSCVLTGSSCRGAWSHLSGPRGSPGCRGWLDRCWSQSSLPLHVADMLCGSHYSIRSL